MGPLPQELLTKADKLTRAEQAKALSIARLQAGGGDVKMIGAVMLWVPLTLFLPTLTVMALAGGILSAAMLLKYSLGLDEPAAAIENAVAAILEKKIMTRDIATPGVTPVSTVAMGDAIVSEIRAA